MNNNWRADLHCHTTCSDGSFTPEELIHHAKAIGLSGLSITDHDTFTAYDIALKLAAEQDLPMIIGAEFSTVFNDTSIHVLAYSFYIQHPLINALCQRHITRREERNQGILDKLAKKGMAISYEDIKSNAKAPLNHSWTRPHIAQALIEKGYVESVKDAFSLYIGDSAPCYVQGKTISTQETLEVIHAAGGFAVLAHPHLIDKARIIPDLMLLPFDGIEVHYGTFTTVQNQRWSKLAKKKQLMMTGGSDFHGSIKPNILLGCSWTPFDTFKILWERSIHNNPTIPRIQHELIPPTS